MGRGFEKGRCPLWRGEDNTLHIILKCSEMRKWRELLLSRKWLTPNEQAPYNIIINCTNIAESADMGKCL
jgi:hypothetical protein